MLLRSFRSPVLLAAVIDARRCAGASDVVAESNVGAGGGSESVGSELRRCTRNPGGATGDPRALEARRAGARRVMLTRGAAAGRGKSPDSAALWLCAWKSNDRRRLGGSSGTIAGAGTDVRERWRGRGGGDCCCCCSCNEVASVAGAIEGAAKPAYVCTLGCATAAASLLLVAGSMADRSYELLLALMAAEPGNELCWCIAKDDPCPTTALPVCGGAPRCSCCECRCANPASAGDTRCAPGGFKLRLSPHAAEMLPSDDWLRCSVEGGCDAVTT